MKHTRLLFYPAVALLSWAVLGAGSSQETAKADPPEILKEIPIPADQAHRLEVLTLRSQLVTSRFETLYQRFLQTLEAKALTEENAKLQQESLELSRQIFEQAKADPQKYTLDVQKRLLVLLPTETGKADGGNNPEKPSNQPKPVPEGRSP